MLLLLQDTPVVIQTYLLLKKLNRNKRLSWVSAEPMG